jgi:hypothetical protein
LVLLAPSPPVYDLPAGERKDELEEVLFMADLLVQPYPFDSGTDLPSQGVLGANGIFGHRLFKGLNPLIYLIEVKALSAEDGGLSDRGKGFGQGGSASRGGDGGGILGIEIAQHLKDA